MELKVSERLKSLRQEKNKTQLEVATALDIADAAYRKYELGTRTPAAEKLWQLADYFGVTIDYIVGRTDQR